MANNTTVVGITTPLDYSFFRHWVDFLAPLHKLNRRDADITASLLYRRFKLSKVIFNDDVLDAVLLSSEQKRLTREEFGISQQNFQVIMAKLRKKKVIVSGKINKRFIPMLDETTEEYKLVIHFRVPKHESEQEQEDL